MVCVLILRLWLVYVILIVYVHLSCFLTLKASVTCTTLKLHIHLWGVLDLFDDTLWLLNNSSCHRIGLVPVCGKYISSGHLLQICVLPVHQCIRWFTAMFVFCCQRHARILIVWTQDIEKLTCWLYMTTEGRGYCQLRYNDVALLVVSKGFKVPCIHLRQIHPSVLITMDSVVHQKFNDWPALAVRSHASSLILSTLNTTPTIHLS